MTLASVIENLSLTFNCFCRQQDRRSAKHNDLLELNDKYNITILPLTDYVIDNLYPKTNKVQSWNIYIVGNDKTFIMSNSNDFDMPVDVLNTRGEKIANNELKDFFDDIFERTLEDTGHDLQFLMIHMNNAYVVNTYCLSNQNRKVIGACAFIRRFDTLPKQHTPKRLSDDIQPHE